MSLLDKMKGVRYRARVFDHNLYLFSVEVPDRGQRYITVTVQKKIIGLFGEEKRIALLINENIHPKLFGGFVQEIDFDIRDAAQLGDLLDVVPDLVYEINQNYKVIQEVRKDEGMGSLMEPQTVPEVSPAPTDGTTEKKEDEKKAPAVPKKPGLIITSAKMLETISALKNTVDGIEKHKIIRECLDLCLLYPKFFYWLPNYLKIDQEVHAIVSQSRIKRVGIIPSYYIAQSNAMIAEKVLARPAAKQGWEQVVIIGIIAAAILGTLGLVVYALTK